ERIEYLSGSAKVMASDFPIRQLIIQEPIDRRTLRSALRSQQERVNAPIVALFSTESELLAQAGGELDPKQAKPFQTLIAQANQEDLEQTSGYAYLDDQAQVVVVVPLYAPPPNIAG